MEQLCSYLGMGPGTASSEDSPEQTKVSDSTDNNSENGGLVSEGRKTSTGLDMVVQDFFTPTEELIEKNLSRQFLTPTPPPPTPPGPVALTSADDVIPRITVTRCSVTSMTSCPKSPEEYSDDTSTWSPPVTNSNDNFSNIVGVLGQTLEEGDGGSSGGSTVGGLGAIIASAAMGGVLGIGVGMGTASGTKDPTRASPASIEMTTLSGGKVDTDPFGNFDRGLDGRGDAQTSFGQWDECQPSQDPFGGQDPFQGHWDRHFPVEGQTSSDTSSSHITAISQPTVSPESQGNRI